MRDDVDAAVTAAWAARNLPGRLDVQATAKLLGFAEHDIPTLIASGKLEPLGDPAPNSPKWFPAIKIVQLALDIEWLGAATKNIAEHWKRKREVGQDSYAYRNVRSFRNSRDSATA